MANHIFYNSKGWVYSPWCKQPHKAMYVVRHLVYEWSKKSLRGRWAFPFMPHHALMCAFAFICSTRLWVGFDLFLFYILVNLRSNMAISHFMFPWPFPMKEVSHFMGNFNMAIMSKLLTFLESQHIYTWPLAELFPSLI